MPPVGSASRVNSGRPRRLVTFSKRERHDRNKRKPVIFVPRHDDSSDSGSDSELDSDSDYDDDSGDGGSRSKDQDKDKDKENGDLNNVGGDPPPPNVPTQKPPSNGAPTTDNGGVNGSVDPQASSISTPGEISGPAQSQDSGSSSVTESAETTTDSSTSETTIPATTDTESTDQALTSSTILSGGSTSSSSGAAAAAADVPALTSLDTPSPIITPTVSPPGAGSQSNPTQSLSPSHTHPNVGAIAGGIIGGLVFLSLFVFGIFIILRRRKNRTAPSAEFLFVHPREYSPFSADSRFQRIGSPAPSFLSSSASSLAPHRGLGDPPPFTPGRFQYPFPEKAPLG